ncbi:MAG: metallophosphoesterase [Patescibacteria group bacterium]
MMQFIFFGVSVIVILFGHAVLWYFLTRLFLLTSVPAQISVAIIISLLFASVILSSYLIHKWDNPFTRWYYMFSGFWIGLGLNLLLIALLIVIIKLVFNLFGWYIPETYFKIFFIAAGLLISIIGVYRAVAPRVVEYEVKIKDLPDTWNNKVVVQISDIHLGPVYRQNSFYRLLARVNDLKPEAVFITGDLFDGMESDFSWLNHPLNLLEAPKGVYYGFGNHDLYLGFDRVISLLKGNKIEILDNRLETIDGLQIIGINYSFDNDFNLEKSILDQSGYSEKLPSILLFHAPKNVPLAKSAGIDLQLSGHTHDGQLWPFNFIAKWAHQGYSYGFFQEGDFNLIVSSGVGSWGPPMRTAARSEIVKIILKKK